MFNLNTHVKITVEVLEKMRNVWGQYFEVEDLVLAMHLYQDAVICPADMKEHDFLEKKMWEIMERCTVNDSVHDLMHCRTLLKSTGFRSYVTYFIDPDRAVDDAIGWTKCVANSVFSGRYISKTEAEKFLIRNGVMRVPEKENQKFGQPIRDDVARRRESPRQKMNMYIKLAALHLVILFFGFVCYYHGFWVKGKSNLLLEIWLGLTPLWFAILIALFPIKYIVLKRFDKKAVKDYERARLMDFYPTHAFFDAPHVYLE